MIEGTRRTSPVRRRAITGSGAVARAVHVVLLATVIAACGSGSDDPVPAVTLTGRAVLPADTFAPGPEVGRALEGSFNGRTPPFPSPPVQGFSSLISDGDGAYLALQDNGFGTAANSADVPLRIYRLAIDLTAGTVEVRGHIELSDPRSLLDRSGDSPLLSGADLDPESFVRLDDGSLWIGEEFGPFLLHFDGEGRLLRAPVPIVVPAALRAHARGRSIYISPDHPSLRPLADDDVRIAAANLPRSGGIEGLAVSPGGDRLYLAVEKALLDDPESARRAILGFDPVSNEFTDEVWFLRTDHAHLSLASLAALDSRTLLVVERDEAEGTQARDKRIYRLDLDAIDENGFVRKTLVCDLLAIADPHGITRSEPGVIGLGPEFAFPYVTPECLLVLDERTLLVANDNNYPFSNGRRPGHPDPNEFVRLRLGRDRGP